MGAEDMLDDFLDGCDLDFTEDTVDDEEAELLALFPDGQADEAKAEAWRELARARADELWGDAVTPPGR